MSDGNRGSYSANALLAAGAGAQCEAGGCPSCVKFGLPVLVVRPGVVGKPHMLQVQGHIRPLLAASGLPTLKYLNYSLRTLKQGYLYAYYEKAHTPEIKSQQGWQLNLVDEGGYLTPVPLMPTPVFEVGDIPAFSCQRTSGYAAAMLFVIPDAKNTGRVWVAYSENPWSPDVLKRYAGDEKLRSQRMVCINAPRASSEASLPMTVSTLQTTVYDYAPSVSSEAAEPNPHQRWVPPSANKPVLSPALRRLLPAEEKQRSEGATDVMEAARKILGQKGPYKEADLMVVLANDIVGLTHEAAVLRTTMFESASQYVLRRAGGDPSKTDWMLKSALSIEGLLASFKQAAAEKRRVYEERNYFAFNKTSMMESQFKSMQAQKQLPDEAVFDYAVMHINGEPVPDPNKPGTVLIPEPEKQAEAQSKKVIGKLSTRDGGYAQFLKEYREKVEVDGRSLLEMEDDYYTCMSCAPRKLLFDNDFDQACAWSGFFYLRTTARVCHAGPITGNAMGENEKPQDGDPRTGKGVDWYVNYLSDDPNLKENILLRALLGNTTKGFQEWLDKRDGHYGLMDNVLQNIEEAGAKPGAATWLRLGSSDFGKNALRLAASGYVSALLPAIGVVLYAPQFIEKIGPKALTRIGKLISVLSNAGARGGKATLVAVSVPLYKALRLWRRAMITVQDTAIDASRLIRGGKPVVTNISDLLRRVGDTSAADAMVDVYLWVDKMPREMEAWAQANTMKAVAATGAVRAGIRQRQYSIRLMPGVATSTWSNMSRTISNNKLLELVSKSSKALASGTVVMASGIGVLSILSIRKNMEQFRAGSDAERAEAAVGMLTGALAFGGAALTLAEDIARRRSRDEGAKVLKLIAGRAVAVASFLDAGVSVIKARHSFRRGDNAGGSVLVIQAVVLGGAGLAAYVGATGSAATILGLSMTGWGLILALVGIGLTFLYYAVKDTPMEEWVGRAYWGTTDSKFSGLEMEQRELDMLRLGVQMEFSLRWLSNSNTPGGKGMLGNVLPTIAVANTIDDIKNGVFLKRGGNRDIYFRLRMPAEFKSLMRIHVGIFAQEKSGGGVAMLNAYSSSGSGSALYLREYPRLKDVQDDVLKDGEEKTENGTLEMWKTSGMRIWNYTQPHAIVWVQEMDKDGEVVPGEAEIKIKLME